MKKRRFLIPLLAFLCLLCAAFSVSCREKHVHKLFYRGALEPTCTTEGRLPHWACHHCDACFFDEHAKNEIADPSSVILPFAAHPLDENDYCAVCDWKKGTEGLVYTPDESEAAYLVSGIGTARGDIVVPNRYNGLQVVGVSDAAFRNCQELTALTLPDTVTRIGSSAFENSSLQSIDIPESVTEIGHAAFRGSALSALHLPSRVTRVRDNAFLHCAALESITVAPGNTVYHSAGNCLIETKTGTLVQGCFNSVIPDDGSVTVIGWGAFADTALAAVRIPAAVTGLESHAFAGCLSLHTVTFDSDSALRLISDSAFEGCAALRAVAIPAAVQHIGRKAFEGCISLTELRFAPNGRLSSLGSMAFRDCDCLTAVALPEGLTNLYGWEFYGCDALRSIHISATVTAIGWNSFAKCPALERLTVASGNTVYHEAGSCIIHTQDKRLTVGCKSSIIPDDGSVTAIGIGAFEGSGLTAIDIPADVTRIQDMAFAYCGSLATVRFADGSKLNSIGSAAFSRCTALTSITLPADVTAIYSGAFDQCTALTAVFFETPRGWQVFDRSVMPATPAPVPVPENELAYRGIAATYLTSTYRSYDWKRS